MDDARSPEPFDRSTYLLCGSTDAHAGGLVETGAQREAEALARAQCHQQGLQLLAFLAALETKLSHAEALALAGQVWRAF